MTSVEFDPDEGLLRLDHAALSVLATLAVRPTDPTLQDHAVAPVVDALRRAGLLGRQGVHRDVAPMVSVVGAAARRLRLSAVDHGVPRTALLWAGEGLLVVGVEETSGRFSLMADRLGAAAELVAELVGLSPTPEPSVGGTGTVRARALLDLLRAGPDAVDPSGVVVRAPGAEWVTQLRRLAVAAPVHWALHDLTVSAARAADPAAAVPQGSSEAPAPALIVVDGGNEGLWWARPAEPVGRARGSEPADAQELDLSPTDPLSVRAALRDLLGV